MIVKPKAAAPLYQVLLLPQREVAASHQTLGEALAWARTYNAAQGAPQVRAVIAEEEAAPPQPSQAA
jgi:hypothetical protein